MVLMWLARTYLWVRASRREDLAAYYAGEHGMASELRRRIDDLCTHDERCHSLQSRTSRFDAVAATRTNGEVHEALRKHIRDFTCYRKYGVSTAERDAIMLAARAEAEAWRGRACRPTSGVK